MAEQQPPAPEAPKPGQAVTVTVRHWYQDPVLTVCLLQFLVAFGMGIQDALQSGGLSAPTFWGCLLAAIVAVIKARAPEVFTGLKVFDKPHDQRNP